NIAAGRPDVHVPVDDDRRSAQRAVAAEAPERAVGAEVDGLQSRAAQKEAGRPAKGGCHGRTEGAERRTRRRVEHGVANRRVANVHLAVEEGRRLAATALAPGRMVPEECAMKWFEVVGLGTGIGDIDA